MAKAEGGQSALSAVPTPAASPEEQETRDVVSGYFEHSYTLDQAQDDSRQDVKRMDSVIRAEQSPFQSIGRQLACMGDEVDAAYGHELKHLAKKPLPQGKTLYEHFADISRMLFSDNVINWGRIAVLLRFGYHLGMEHVIKDNVPSVLSDIIGYVVRFILTERVTSALKSIASWILEKGGWVAAAKQGIEELGTNWAYVGLVLGLCMSTISLVVLLKK